MNKFICLMFIFLLSGCGTPKDIENIGYNNLNFDSQKIKDKTPVKKEYNKRCFLFFCNTYRNNKNMDEFVYETLEEYKEFGNALMDISIVEETKFMYPIYLNKKIILTGNIFEKE